MAIEQHRNHCDLPDQEQLLLPAAPASSQRALIERLFARQQYEKRFGPTGNDILRQALPIIGERIVSSPDTIPEIANPHEAILETYESSYSRAARAIFLSGIQDNSERAAIQRRFCAVEADLAAYFPVVYGTSGTEINAKEIGNTLGAVTWLERQGRAAIGIYFIEDQGHPFSSTLRQEAEMLSVFVASQHRLSIEQAKDVVFPGLTKLYETGSIGIYNPEQTSFEDIVNPKSREALKDYFIDNKNRKSDPLAGTALDIPAPRSVDIREVYRAFGFPSQIIEMMARTAEFLSDNSTDFGGTPSVADFRTVLQGVIGLQVGYEGYGAEAMPIWAIDTWSNICKRSGVKKGITVGDTKDLLEAVYPGQNKRVINFACSSCRTEHGIHTTEQPKGTHCGFEKLTEHIEQVPVEQWV